MKKKEMKKVLPAIVAVVLVFGAGLAMAGINGNGQGVPSAKCALGEDAIDIIPASDDGDGVWVNEMFTVLKTENKADLVISFTAECALVTDVKIKGTGKPEEDTSMAQIKVRALVDGDEAEPGEVVFAYRTMTLKGLLWGPDDVDPEGSLDLPEQYIEIYEATRTANGFNFVMQNVPTGVHTITVQVMTDKKAGDFDGAQVGAVIGQRTLVVESLKMAN